MNQRNTDPSQLSTVSFQPVEFWPNKTNRQIDVAVGETITGMNREDPKALIKDLAAKVETADNGIKYAILRGAGVTAREYSSEEAFVMFNPFAAGATPNMLVRAELVRRVAKRLEIRSADGNLIPVIMLASPAIGGSSLSLDQQQIKAIKSGEFGPIVREYLNVVIAKDFGRFALAGFSQGADIALQAAVMANKNEPELGADIKKVTIGDPAGVMNRSRSEIGVDFMRATNLGDMVKATGLRAQKTALGAVDFAKFGLSAALLKENRALMTGLGSNEFEELANDLLASKKIDKFVVGYGAKSAIAQPDAIEPQLKRLHEKYGSERLISIKVGQDSQHTWGDRLRWLSKLYLRAYF